MTLEETNFDANAVQEELVAYLDGELSSEESAHVENRLGNDAEYRQQLQSLQKTWDLLDVIPTTEASPDFTQSTVAIVALNAKKDVDKQIGNLLKKKSFFWGAIVIASLVFASVGYGVTNRILSANNRQLVDDLSVIENVDRLRNIESVEFLEQLAQSGLFDE